MQQTMTIDWPAVITSLATLAGGVGLYLQQRATRKDLKENTKATEETKAKATEVAVSVERVNQAQFDYAELWELRRWKAAFDSLPECSDCKDSVARMADRRRLRPHTGGTGNGPTERVS